MKKMGILLAFAPEQPISNQGIGRLTAFIISAVLKKNEVKISLAAPDWYKATIMDFLADHRIDAKEIEVITTGNVPFLLRIRGWVKRVFARSNKFKYKSIQSKFRNKFESINLKLMIRGFSSSSPFGFIMICVLAALSVIPLAIVGLAAILIFKMYKFGFDFVKRKFGVSMKLNPSLLLAPLATFRRNLFVHRVYQGVRNAELNKLINIMNTKKDIDVWFVPTLFWPEIEGIKAKKVVAAPDIVFLDFPLLFTDPFYGMVYGQISQTIRAADHFICYSQHVKQKHLMEHFFLDAEKISVVKHGAIHMDTFLDAKHSGSGSKKYIAASILKNYQQSSLVKNPYLKDFELGDVKYIFYSSQIRPHKNFMQLIMAYEKLLRNRFINIKLFTTADLTLDKNVWDYIVEKRLQYDILCFPHVSSEVLAALNHLAVCVVNPTLFEGGFPFTFTEAYSVGTPSIMSSIPAVLDEVTDPNLREAMLFDPYNLDDMINKIEWAIKNREALFALEEPLYRKLEARTWEIVANEYIEVLKTVGNQRNEVFA